MPRLSEILRDHCRTLPPFDRLVWLLLGIAVIGTVLQLSGGFDLGRLAGKEYWIAQARSAVQEKNWSAAAAALQHVPEQHQHDPRFLRVLADCLTGTLSNPQMLAQVLEQLQSTAEARPEDQLWLARAWIGAGSVAKARTAWNGIPVPLSQGLEAARLNIDLLRQEGLLREADQAEHALADFFADVPTLAVRQAVAEINGPFPEVRVKAHARLWELARRQDAAGLDAIRMLSRQSGRTAKEADELLTLVNAHPAARPADRLDIVSLRMRLTPIRRAEWILAEVERYQRDRPEILAQLATWLAREGQAEWLQELSANVKLPPQEWFQCRARALAETKQWQQLLKLVEQQEKMPQPMSQAEIARWHAVALMQLHPQETTASHARLQQAIRQGGIEKNFAVVSIAARIAEDWHMPDLALEAYQVLAQPGSPQEAAMLENALRIATSLKDTATLAALSARLARLQPDNVRSTRRAAYLGLLRGENLELTVSTTAAITDSDTTGWFLAAFKAWRLGDQLATRDSMRHIQDTTGLNPGERAVFAGLLAKTGEIARAFQIAEKIRPELLLPEEVTFLNMAK